MKIEVAPGREQKIAHIRVGDIIVSTIGDPERRDVLLYPHDGLIETAQIFYNEKGDSVLGIPGSLDEYDVGFVVGHLTVLQIIRAFQRNRLYKDMDKDPGFSAFINNMHTWEAKGNIPIKIRG